MLMRCYLEHNFRIADDTFGTEKRVRVVDECLGLLATSASCQQRNSVSKEMTYPSSPAR